MFQVYFLLVDCEVIVVYNSPKILVAGAIPLLLQQIGRRNNVAVKELGT